MVYFDVKSVRGGLYQSLDRITHRIESSVQSYGVTDKASIVNDCSVDYVNSCLLARANSQDTFKKAKLNLKIQKKESYKKKLVVLQLYFVKTCLMSFFSST